MASARRAAWPPAPKVQSTNVMPGSTSSQATTSRARTGRCGVRLAGLTGQTLGNMFDAPFELLEGTLPGLPVPDLQPVAQTGDDDVALETRVAHERGRHRHAPLPVELQLHRASEQEALELPALAGERVDPCRLRRHE